MATYFVPLMNILLTKKEGCMLGQWDRKIVFFVVQAVQNGASGSWEFPVTVPYETFNETGFGCEI
jgi:hypothetical protein